MAETRHNLTLTQEELKEYLDYDHVSGDFVWLKPPSYRSPKLIGTIAGSVYKNGYRYIAFKGVTYKAARLAWFWIFGEWPFGYIDHADGNRSNDSFENLRECSNSENQGNRGLMVTNTSGVTGVAWDSSRSKWRAAITLHGRAKFIGRYDSKEEAEAAYQAAAEKHFGEFAGHLNREQIN